MHDKLIKFGKRLAYLRNSRNLTQEQLAEKIGYSTNHISKLESAKTNPSFELLIDLSDALDVNIQDLFDFDEYKNTDIIKKELEAIIKSNNEKNLKLIYRIYKSLKH